MPRDTRLSSNPFQQFRRWYADARRRVPMADAMCLSTVNAKGFPSARMVLLKSINAKGFTFFTNIHSPKARDLQARPHAALTFHWVPLRRASLPAGRQVRVEGQAVRVLKKEADAYFATRPRLSQIGAWASHQSQPLTSRKQLDDRFKAYEALFAGKKVPAPIYWQGFCVIPDRIEFWQEGPNRLHDRWVFVRQKGRWHPTRLNP